MTALQIGLVAAAFCVGVGAGIILECWYQRRIAPDCDNGAAEDSMTSDPVDVSAETEARLAIARRNILDALEKREPGRWSK